MSIIQLNLFLLISVVLFLMKLEVIEMWYLIQFPLLFCAL